VPARERSEKATSYGAFAGATVVRSVEDWLLGDTDGTALQLLLLLAVSGRVLSSTIWGRVPRPAIN